MEYRELGSESLIEASKLVWSVFSEFVAPDYVAEGVETFKKFIEPQELEKTVTKSSFFMIGSFDKEKLIGVIAMRDINHVSLLFVDKAYHGRGIAKELFDRSVKKCFFIDSKLNEITVNSSPFAVEIYKRLGFKINGDQTTTNGITYIPMRKEIWVTGENAEIEEIRHIKKHELNELLELYKHMNKDDPSVEENEKLNDLWNELLGDPGQHYLVTDVNGKIVASCVLIVIKNLTRGLKPYAIIENVVTHEDFRKKGYATRLLKYALEIAKDKGCYKVMLMTGRGEDTIKFYEKVGFVKGKKTGLIVKFE